ncbi:MAG: efflux RND transporter periplasmic adaptor subunit [Leptolyngbya sp. SIO4C1]|nr:efflux RND transporter periplasmic adaptor subunit [Leptolyngbya sp. SIO4C1]
MESVAKPQPLAQNPRNWLLAAAALIVIAGGGFALWRLFGPKGGPQAGGPQAVPVTLERMQSTTVREQAEFVGTLDSQAGVVLQPEASGRITRIYVSSGDQVAAGDPVMELSADRSQAELNAALASVSAARSARDNARAQLRSLEAQRIRLEAEVELQNTEYDRAQRLVAAGALAQQELDEVARDRSAAVSSLAASAQEIEAARASLNQADAFLTQSEATAAATQEDLLDKTVTAPIAGTVGDIEVELGDYVQAGSTLTTITQNNDLELEISVPTEQAEQMRVGMPVELLTFGSDTPITTGAISFISPQTDPDTQTVLAKARFSGGAGRLQDNQRIDVRVILEEGPGLLVPATAVTRLGGQTFVYVTAEPEPSEGEAGAAQGQSQSQPQGQDQAPQQVAKLRPVTLGDMQGNSYQVLDGLSPGETIVTSGLLNLQDGTPIAPQSESESAASSGAQSNSGS